MIRKSRPEDLNQLDQLALEAVKDMHANGIFQWTNAYPRKAHFSSDITKDVLYVFEDQGTILGVMAFYDENEPLYRKVSWLREKSIVIHRILVHPSAQHRGIATQLLAFAYQYAKQNAYESIKIDTHPGNYRMRNFLKKHHFHELDYIQAMHRIAFERLIENHAMKRIVILGSSGTGKTTLSRRLGEKLQIPYLHLDAVYWERNWTSIHKTEFTKRLRAFIRKHPRFVIDGNYTGNVNFMERLAIADTIILLDYPRQYSLKGIIEREAKYKHRFRSDMATGCIEQIDQEFLKYVYQFDNKKHKLSAIMNHYVGQKYLLRFKDRQSLNRWFDSL